MHEETVVKSIRKFILLLFLFGVTGTGVELILLNHMEDYWQWTPLILLATGLLVLGGYAVYRRRVLLFVFRGLTGCFMIGGLLGLYFHYRGNVEFELEMYPDAAGLELIREALTGATPALAPGAMILLGLMGLCYTYRHPTLNQS